MFHSRKTVRVIVRICACLLLGWASVSKAEGDFSEIVSFGASWDMNSWTNGNHCGVTAISAGDCPRHAKQTRRTNATRNVMRDSGGAWIATVTANRTWC